MKLLNTLFVIALCLAITACGPNRKNISMDVQSDPLGAYTLLQVKYKENENSDWIFLGSTPIKINKSIIFSNATAVSLKVIRPGFHDQVKSWSRREFIKEHQQANGILWIPNMVQQ